MFMMVPRAEVCAERIDGGARHRADRACRRLSPVTVLDLPRAARASRGVEFRYPGAEQPVLQDISLRGRARPDDRGHRRHRRGKTTLLNLIPRLFDVTAEHVLVDGVDVRELEPGAAVGSDRAGPAEAVPVLRDRRPPTCATAIPRRPTTSSGRPSRSPRPATSSRRCPTAWTPPSPRAAPTCPAASGSGWRSRGRSSHRPEIYLFDDSFSALDYATDAAAAGRAGGRDGARRPSSSWPSGSPRSGTPTGSSSSRPAGSSRPAPTTS